MSPDCWLALVLIGVVGLVISNDASAACYQQGPANSTILNANCKDMVVVSVKQQPLKMTFSSTATGHDTIDQPFELLLGACTVLLTFAFTSGGPLVYLGADTMAMPVEATVDNQGITFLYLGNQLTASCGTSPVFAGDPNGKQTVTIGIKPKSITPKGLEKLKLTIYSPVLSVEKDDDMDIKTTIAIIAGCVCVVLCFSSSVGSSSYGSVYCYRKHKKRKELKKQKTTKQLPPTSNIPPTPNNNQGYTYSSNMEVPRASLFATKISSYERFEKTDSKMHECNPMA
ncbi:hypothetical protein M3Y94_01276400 [Aphelenchoides besseyi]|nr:hypothetical protein M3Y94_01276400 [Aphelenchoides besseyi]